MEDPRIEELMDYIDAADDAGEPTAIALIARRVESYLEVVAELRVELDEHHKAADDLEARASNLAVSLKERELLRNDITDAAQTAVMRVALTTSTGRATQVKKEAAEKQRALQQFEADYENDDRRYKAALRALDGKQARLMELRDQVARRMNIIDALLQRAEIEWPSYFFDENERMKAKKSAASSTVRRRPSRGGRRRIIRRRRAS